jgi:cytochrome c oxidase subunit 2
LELYFRRNKNENFITDFASWNYLHKRVYTSNQIEPTGEIKEFELTAKQWEFSPNTITVNRGDIVKIHIESVDVTHGFALPDFGVNEILEPGNDIHVDFVADKVGTFTFFCSVSCGSGHSGMNGQLIVK